MLLAPYQWVLPGMGVRKSGAGIFRRNCPQLAGNSYAAATPNVAVSP